MNPPPIDFSDIYHVARKGYHESKQAGKPDGQLLAMMGICLVGMGAMMAYRGLGRER